MSANAFLWLLLLFLLLGLLVAFRVYRAYIPPVQPARLHYPYALLLGCPSHDDGTMSTSQRLRCETALEAWRQGRFDTLVISGSNVKNEYVEAREMAKWIEAAAPVPLILETKARNTYENLKYAKERIGDVPLLIITSSLHAPRADAMARDFFTDHSVCTYPDHKPRHILREIASRWIFISIERQKKATKKEV